MAQDHHGRQEDFRRQSWWVTAAKQPLPDFTVAVTACTRSSQPKLQYGLVWGDSETPPWAEELLTINGCWRDESWFSSDETAESPSSGCTAPMHTPAAPWGSRGLKKENVKLGGARGWSLEKSGSGFAQNMFYSYMKFSNNIWESTLVCKDRTWNVYNIKREKT